MSIRVAVVEDSFLVREALGQLLGSDSRIQLIAMCDTSDALLRAVERERPDVVLTDIRMSAERDDDGIRLAALLRERHPQIGVVVLSQYVEPRYALDLLEGGSQRRAYLLKERVHERGQLFRAIEAVAGGGSVIEPKVVDVLIEHRARRENSVLSKLTSRERQILGELAQGKSNQAIADSLVLTKRAVEKHVNSIFSKLGLTDAEHVSRRVRAALLFLAESDV